MTFLHPIFAWGFLSLAVILILYLLKRKYEVRNVPSTFLWRKAGQELSASKPFQKLRRNVLLPIQLLMAAVLVFALMRPVLPGNAGGETVMIFDLSASMRAKNGSETRLEEAVETARGIIDGMRAEDALTILAVSNDTQQLLMRSTDRGAARRVLNGLAPSNSTADLSGAVSLAEAMEREVGELNIIVFSDDYIPSDGIAVHNANQGLDNCAVYSFEVENGVGYARAVNYGDDKEITLACYAEGVLCDARTLHIPAGGSEGTTLNIPECRWAYVEIQENDSIQTDNRLYYVAEMQRTYTVALSGESSIFLERAIALRDDIQIIRTTDEERNSVDADLYVYGDSPLYFTADPEIQAILAGEETAPRGIFQLSGDDGLTSGLTLSDVAVRAYRPLIGGRTLMTIDDQCVMAVDGRTVALGFDIHDTNLPMKYDFPILIQNILHELLPENAADVGDGFCGEDVVIPVPADCANAWIEMPDGQHMQLSLPDGGVAQHSENNAEGADLSAYENGAVRFSGTTDAGLYTLVIEDGSGSDERYFALRMPLSESDVRFTAPSIASDGAAAAFEGGKELTTALIALFLLLTMIEWVVRRRVA